METKFIRNKIIDILIKNRGVSNSNYLDDTTLMDDLGIDGQDAYDVMNDYFNYFKIDKSNFVFEDYFGYEGFSITEIVKTIFRVRKLKHMTIKLLIENALKGRWED